MTVTDRSRLVQCYTDSTMRLSSRTQQIIRDSVRTVFGDHAKVMVFGSRVNEEARGGDIDLYIEIDGGDTPRQRLERELKLYALLQKALGEQRIDLVIHERGATLKAIDKEASSTGLIL